MEILRYQNVLLMKHTQGDEATARQMSNAARILVKELLGRYPRVAAIQEDHNFSNPSAAFFQIWGEWVREHEQRVLVVAYTPNAWARAIAKSVAQFARVDFETEKNFEDAVEIIVRNGFPDITNVPWHSAFNLGNRPAAE